MPQLDGVKAALVPYPQHHPALPCSSSSLAPLRIRLNIRLMYSINIFPPCIISLLRPLSQDFAASLIEYPIDKAATNVGPYSDILSNSLRRLSFCQQRAVERTSNYPYAEKNDHIRAGCCNPPLLFQSP